MMAKLHDLFRHLYLTPKYVADEDSQRLLTGVFNMQSTLHTGLLDYKDYIAIKTQRNVAMTKYPFSTWFKHLVFMFALWPVPLHYI